MRKIFIDEEQVSTLEELAETLASQYGWTSYMVDGDEIYFKANADGEPVDGRLEITGHAYDIKSGEPLDEWDVCWNEIFDAWSDYVWAEDENGRTVMLHN